MKIETIAPGHTAYIEALPAAGLPYLLAGALSTLQRPIVLLVDSDERGEQACTALRTFGCSDVVLLKGQRHVACAAAAPDPDIVFSQCALRFRVLTQDQPAITVLTPSALSLNWLPTAEFLAHHQSWKVGEETPQEEVAAYLVRCGYRHVNMAEDPGTFSSRGSIIDIFLPDYSGPIRLDFFGDELTSARRIDVRTQRVVANLEKIDVYPIREVVFSKRNVERALANMAHLAEELDIPTKRIREYKEEIEQHHYFYGIEALWPLFYDGTESAIGRLLDGGPSGLKPLLVLDNGIAIEEALEERAKELDTERQRALERFEPVADELEATPRRVRALLKGTGDLPSLVAQPLLVESGPHRVVHSLKDWAALTRELHARHRDAERGEILDPVVDVFNTHLTTETARFFFSCGSRGAAERLRELLRGRRIDLPIVQGLHQKTLEQYRCAIVVAPLGTGFIDEERQIAVLTDVEIFGKPQSAGIKRKASVAKNALSTLHDLRPEDLIIHVDHGIGRYQGLKRLILNGVDGDYIHLEYADGDGLYIPVYGLAVLQRYQGPKDRAKLDKLGGTRWERTKQRVKDTVLAVAHKLLAVQASRKTKKGFACDSPNEHFRAFEASFPYEETPDQQAAIDAVLKDLTQTTPMDRLICGDVGFGKTEVAIRAAYLAIMSGYQVAVLVPTTVLAEQHGASFKERLAAHGVEVQVLSRFRSAKEARDIIARSKDGSVDVLIGTHRLLSPDVAFKSLGLLVVDEEQRFGVKNKERIKEMRAQVHVLTLSATPIPRTLHMAMMGLRELSIISTPPTERSSIVTEVTRYHEDIVQSAIRSEIQRGGQVFFVHNRVQSIDAMAETLHGLVPEVKIGVAHGQMSSSQLERIMIRFIEREFHLLLCTTIIESGIDIPSANTMIINRADTFGLSQLHQLRGRIGRSKNRAFAYLLLPRAERLTKIAAERLGILKRFSELGAGFHIASHDLDIRGAGDLLGEDQSGSIAAVGFELYMELLKEAVQKAEGQRASGVIEPDIKLPVAAVLPEAYVPDPIRRIEYYQRMSSAQSDEEIFDLVAEIESRYGEAAGEVHALAEVMVIRRRLRMLGVLALSGAIVKSTTEAEQSCIRMGLSFVADAPVDRLKLTSLLENRGDKYRLLPSGRLMLTIPTLPETSDASFLERVREELGSLAELLLVSGHNWVH